MGSAPNTSRANCESGPTGSIAQPARRTGPGDARVRRLPAIVGTGFSGIGIHALTRAISEYLLNSLARFMFRLDTFQRVAAARRCARGRVARAMG